ncbi:MAG: hypothetical protein LBB26_00470 [Puniceicoccales bacterium]|nr:hypothetical protein [Puniceicoccales bacterium]
MEELLSQVLHQPRSSAVNPNSSHSRILSLLLVNGTRLGQLQRPPPPYECPPSRITGANIFTKYTRERQALFCLRKSLRFLPFPRYGSGSGAIVPQYLRLSRKLLNLIPGMLAAHASTQHSPNQEQRPCSAEICPHARYVHTTREGTTTSYRLPRDPA